MGAKERNPGRAEPNVLGTPRDSHVRLGVNHCVDHCLAFLGF